MALYSPVKNKDALGSDAEISLSLTADGGTVAANTDFATGEPTCSYVAGNLACLSSLCCFVFHVFLLVIFAPIFAVLHLCYPNSFQLWALQRPENCISKLFLPWIATFESIGVGATSKVFPLWMRWGNNFCAAGEVWLGSFADVSEALLSPQVRTYQLGEHPLQIGHLPAESRCVFLLALSDKAAGGNGYHEAFRAAVQQYLFDAEAVEARRTDATAQGLIDQLEKDYGTMNTEMGGDFWNASEGGLKLFFTRYLHYVMFGVDPNDSAAQAVLRNFFIGQAQLMHYLQPLGFLVNKSKDIEAVCEVYSRCPAFENFRENVPAHANMTKREICLLMVSIMRIAGVQGSTQLLTNVLGGREGTDYAKTMETGKYHGRSYLPELDKLDLENVDAVKRHIHEMSRLEPPVTVTHRVATEAFSCKISGQDYSFPKGTKVAIPMCLAAIDKAYWGDDAWQYDLQRSQLLESSMAFNSVGPKHGGRVCPGEALITSTAVTVVQRLGRFRRTKLSLNGATGPKADV
eukprot:TRINITY_DN2672_c0_g1_i2.p1 TRINITY_DN2672_c0_g1~~TRINITY_DN2672_c0_g1_i2.p1  ORF type:complete len:518 (-),score=81.87 TRINITY_DN2672_c0_g1_i2:275-1828(-)